MTSEKQFSIKDTNIHKGIAILMILGIPLFVRSNRSLYAYNWEIDGLPVLNYVFNQLKIGVTIFCLLSGYGLNESYKKNHKSYGDRGKFGFAFLRSHLSKLLVNYWVIFVLFAGIGLALGLVSVAGTWGGVKKLIVDFLGLQDVVYDFWPTKTLNPTWWYMSTIIVLYLLFPLVKKIMRFNPYLPVALGVVLQIIAPYTAYRQAQYGFVYYFAAFALGILFSEKQVLNRVKNYNFKRKWIAVIVAVFITGAAFLFRCYNRFWGDLPFALSFMFLIQLVIVDAKNKISSIFANAISYIGKHSFNIFAVHTFYITIYGKDIIYKLRNPLLMYVVLVLISLLTSIILEKIKNLSGLSALQKNNREIGTLLSGKESVPFDKRQSMKIKGVAISLLIFHHLFYSDYRLSYGGVVTHFISKEMLTSLGTYARICVWLFVFVSAYGLTKSYLAMGEKTSAHDNLSFYRRHYFSLMKPYWLIWGVLFAVTFLFSVKPAALLQKNFLYVILNFLGWSDFFGMPGMNNTWWYMCLAQIVLLLIPPLCEMVKKWGGISFLLIFVLIQFINMSGITSNFGGEYINYLFMVLIGVLCARYNVMEKISEFRFTFLGAVLLILMICFGMYWNRELDSVDKWNICKVFLSVSAFGICVFVYKFIAKGIAEKALVFLGKHSGNMFFIHIFLFERSYKPQLVFWSHNVVVSWLSCMILSVIVSIIIEFIKKCFSGRVRRNGVSI